MSDAITTKLEDIRQEVNNIEAFMMDITSYLEAIHKTLKEMSLKLNRLEG